MGRRISYELPNVEHSAPIPMAARAGNLFISSAVMGADPATGKVPTDGHRQVELAFQNVRTLLDEAGIADDDVAYVSVLLGDNDLREQVNDKWIVWFPRGDHRPARHTTVRELPGDMVVQLQVFAMAS